MQKVSPKQVEKIVAFVNRKRWWHVPPRDPDAYRKRGKFLASSFTDAEFWERPLNEVQRVAVVRPLADDELAFWARGAAPGICARPIYLDVRGAPFKIGDRVRVTGSEDETFDHSYKGRIGIVAYFEYECGCGQRYPRDPMIGVGFRKGRIEEFWAEELRLQLALTRRYRRSRRPQEPG